MKPHILLVDDDEVVLMTVSAMIESLGLSCDTAINSQIAKEKLEENKFQIGYLFHFRYLYAFLVAEKLIN